MGTNLWSRRDVIVAASALGLPPKSAAADPGLMHTRRIPATDERLPVIGLGTYAVFDVAGSAGELAERREILKMLVDAGGSVVDSSPMYNRAEKVVGDLIEAGISRERLFIATKVWIDGRDNGIAQMKRSARLMHSEVIDLMQVHNLRDTRVHMPSIREAQHAGRIRYSGLTHYSADAHAALEAQMLRYRPDFIQVNYSLAEREAGERLLPLARDLGIAVVVNRPFQAGRLFAAVEGRPLPDWAEAFAATWGQFFLKFIVSHPAVTCAIPATSKPHHMADNLMGGFGALPDDRTRRRMVGLLEEL